MKVQFTDRAESDLRAIVTYSKRSFGHQQAVKYVTQLREQVRSLSDAPGMGKKCGELAPVERFAPLGYLNNVYYPAIEQHLSL